MAKLPKFLVTLRRWPMGIKLGGMFLLLMLLAGGNLYFIWCNALRLLHPAKPAEGFEFYFFPLIEGTPQGRQIRVAFFLVTLFFGEARISDLLPGNPRRS